MNKQQIYLANEDIVEGLRLALHGRQVTATGYTGDQPDSEPVTGLVDVHEESPELLVINISTHSLKLHHPRIPWLHKGTGFMTYLMIDAAAGVCEIHYAPGKSLKIECDTPQWLTPLLKAL